MSKSFQVPEPITVAPWVADDPGVRPNNKPEVKTFLQFASFVWLDDGRGLTDAQGKSSLLAQRRWDKVVGKFEAAKPGDWITLEDQDYATLKRIVEAPARAYANTRIMTACLPFSDVVLGAVDEVQATPATGN